jgi:hypothetical protein
MDDCRGRPEPLHQPLQHHWPSRAHGAVRLHGRVPARRAAGDRPLLQGGGRAACRRGLRVDHAMARPAARGVAMLEPARGPRSGGGTPASSRGGGRRGDTLHLHVPVAPDRGPQRAGPRLDDHPEPFPQQPTCGWPSSREVVGGDDDRVTVLAAPESSSTLAGRRPAWARTRARPSTGSVGASTRGHDTRA